MLNHSDMSAAILRHSQKAWPGRSIETFVWAIGPRQPNSQVYRVAPGKPGDPWIYASSGAWQAETREGCRYEFFLMAPKEDPIHVETLAMLTRFQSSGSYNVGPGKIVDIGRPWVDGGTCDHLLVSVPYPIGPALENFDVPEASLKIRFLWLMPITGAEATFACKEGVEALERKFEAAGINSIDAKRKSVVAG